ncbi:hypothetical protein HPB49_020905 [Dermacentor silvarum]|uniref:Uncharacterized protein n=1 Tax=Dermacentor silvarum TaxID=543639 RepID=A0ACB8CT00_DERSI|nr:hypothetical protein HPB49_020905 [Dermacentor silvarum]
MSVASRVKRCRGLWIQRGVRALVGSGQLTWFLVDSPWTLPRLPTERTNQLHLEKGRKSNPSHSSHRCADKQIVPPEMRPSDFWAPKDLSLNNTYVDYQFGWIVFADLSKVGGGLPVPPSAAHIRRVVGAFLRRARADASRPLVKAAERARAPSHVAVIGAADDRSYYAMHSSNSSPPSSSTRRRSGGGSHHPGSFFTIPRWMGGGGSGGSKKQLQYRSLRSLEDPTPTSTTTSGRRKRPSLFDQMVKRFFTPHVGHHQRGGTSSESSWNGVVKYPAPSRSGSLRDLRTRAVGGDPGGGDDTFFAGNGGKKHQPDGAAGSALSRTAVPAVAGIRNEGNTCFMNAVLQCLSNTDAFAEYLVSGSYREDLARAKGRGGFATPSARVTEQLAHVLGALWSCRTEGDFAARFKACVEKHGSQYQGSEQHDAQEFLMWLLDKVHEELLADDATTSGGGGGGSSSSTNTGSRSRRGSLKRSKVRSVSRFGACLLRLQVCVFLGRGTTL